MPDIVETFKHNCPGEPCDGENYEYRPEVRGLVYFVPSVRCINTGRELEVVED